MYGCISVTPVEITDNCLVVTLDVVSWTWCCTIVSYEVDRTEAGEDLGLERLDGDIEEFNSGSIDILRAGKELDTKRYNGSGQSTYNIGDEMGAMGNGAENSVYAGLPAVCPSPLHDCACTADAASAAPIKDLVALMTVRYEQRRDGRR